MYKLIIRYFIFLKYNLRTLYESVNHGMARPQVVDRGTASDKEGSCE